MTLDNDSRAVLRRLAEAGVRPMQEQTPASAREQLRSGRPPADALVPMAGAAWHSVPAGDGVELRVRVLVPSAEPRAVVVYLHGGGWVVGEAEDFEPLCRVIARATGCAVAIVDYRLAPEHPYPAAVGDALRAVHWAHRELAHGLPVILAGDSAGGNLAAVTARRCRDGGGPPIALQVLVYPVTDWADDTDSYRDRANQLYFSRATMAWFWDHYLAEPDRRTEPDASPLRVVDLAELPPALVVTAEHDVLRDEGEAYARRLTEAGVQVRHYRALGQMHGFLSRYLAQPSARRELDRLCTELTELLETAGTPATEDRTGASA